jgi:uncharacterized protein YydD (DUF2326 family)
LNENVNENANNNKNERDDVRHERELREQWQKSHESFHILDKEALVLARKEIDRRLNDMNQFRAQIEKERGDFLQRDMYDQQYGTLRGEVDARFNVLRNETDARLKLLENTKSNLEGRIWAIGGVITALAVGLNLMLHYLR